MVSATKEFRYGLNAVILEMDVATLETGQIQVNSKAPFLFQEKNKRRESSSAQLMVIDLVFRFENFEDGKTAVIFNKSSQTFQLDRSRHRLHTWLEVETRRQYRSRIDKATDECIDAVEHLFASSPCSCRP